MLFFIFFGVPHLATCIFLFFYIVSELGVGIDPGMSLTPLPSNIGLDRDRTHDLPIVRPQLLLGQYLFFWHPNGSPFQNKNGQTATLSWINRAVVSRFRVSMFDHFHTKSIFFHQKKKNSSNKLFSFVVDSVWERALNYVTQFSTRILWLEVKVSAAL